MAERLRGKTALVTAAGQGIGRATALAFAAEGASVTASDIDAGKLADLPKNIAKRRLDVTDGAAVDALATELGALHVLFNCAGFVHHGTILDCAEADWDFTMALNLKAMYRVIRAFLPAMLARGGGSIVNMSSSVSSIKGAPNRFVYGVSKAGVIGLTKSVAIDFIRQGIRCNAICPGTVASPSLEGRIAAQGGGDPIRKAFIDRQPIGRLGRPRRSPRSRSISPATNPPLPRAQRISSTAVSRCRCFKLYTTDSGQRIAAISIFPASRVRQALVDFLNPRYPDGSVARFF
jgi:2-keto-3-deoxy-L-fuconate dehydrogenase